MTRTLILVAAVVLAAVAASWLSGHPGHVTIEWLGWRADTSVAMLAFLVVVMALIGAAGQRFWGYLRVAPRRLLEAYRARRQRRGYEALSAGMIAAASGDAPGAGRHARRAESLLEDAGLTRLLRAQAARLGGDETAARRTYEEMADRPETALLGIRGLLEQAEAKGDKAEALQLAEKAFRLQPNAQGVAERLFDLQVAFGHWADADATIGQALRRKIMPAGDARRRRAAVLLARSGDAEDAGDTEVALAFAREAHQLDPERVAAAIRHAVLLGRDDKQRRAVKILEKAWSVRPHPEIAAAYAGLFESDDVLARVKRYQRLLSFRPDHVEGHVALAQAALDAKLWGEARAHLGHAAERGVTPRLCRLFADLEESEHGDLKAARQWLERAGTAPPDPVWVCEDCGATAGAWSARCDSCGAFDSLEWRPPAQISQLPARPNQPALADRRGGGAV